MFRIITDSTADLPKEFLQENQITCMKLSYMVNGECYGPQKDLDSKEFYKLMRDGNMPTTSQVNPEDAKHILEAYVPEEKEILVLAFSSGLSGTYNSIRLAASELMEEYPDVRIEVIDTLAASLGEGLIVYKDTVAAAALVSDEDSILIVGDKTGVCISAQEIALMGRGSLGNQLIKGSKIKSVTKV